MFLWVLLLACHGPWMHWIKELGYSIRIVFVPFSQANARHSWPGQHRSVIHLLFSIFKNSKPLIVKSKYVAKYDFTLFSGELY